MTTALISIFHPSNDVREHVRAIASQVDVVYLCDNSPESHAQMFEGPDFPGNIRYTCFHTNLGLSIAFNQILKDPDIPWNDEDYIIFFDQDSLIKESHISKLIAVYDRIKGQGIPIGCLGCAFFNTSHGAVEMPRAKQPLSDDTYAVSSIITSSMLTTYGNLRKIDFWDTHVFLDMADWNLCWRLQAAGMLCCLTDAVILHHSVGSSEKKIGPLRLRVGHPMREYYQIRECMYLLWQPYTPLKYRVRFLAMLLVRSPLHVIFLDHRKERLGYIAKGFLDFFRGKQGPMDP